MDSVNAMSCKEIRSFGEQLKGNMPWYPQELCLDWPHEAAAMSFGESSVVKQSMSYPRRSGLDAPEESDFPEFCEYYSKPREEADDEIDELYVSRGACVLSTGPIGGPSKLKAIYRPLTSYGTGVGIRSVAKVTFPVDPLCPKSRAINRNDEYICLAEKAGISFYREGSSESHVVYLPEFQIEKIVPCTLGLLVIPKACDETTREGNEDRRMYILTDPVKQVSKIWLKNLPGQDYTEYDSASEKFLGCEGDICFFWSLDQDRIILRRIAKLDPTEMLQSSALNASTYQFHMTQLTSTDHCSDSLGTSHYGRPHSPQQSNILMFAPFRRPHSPQGSRLNREGSNLYLWPTLDASNTCMDSSVNHGLAHGFYPPHVCVYDDPEVCFRNMFSIDLAEGRWAIPHQFKVTPARSSGRMALLFHMKHRLYVHGVDVNSGKKLSHYCIKDIKDYSAADIDGISILVWITRSRVLKIGWFDSDYSLTCSTFINVGCDIDGSLSLVCNVFYCDTILLETATKTKYFVRLRNWRKNNLVRKCVENLKETLNSRIVTWIVARYMEHPKKSEPEVSSAFDTEWEEFVEDVEDVVSNEPINTRAGVASKIIHVVDTLKESLKIHHSSRMLASKLDTLRESMSKLLNPKNSKKLVSSYGEKGYVSLYQRFANLIIAEDPEHDSRFESLPEILQLIISNPYKVENLSKIVEIYNAEAAFAPAVEIIIADIFVQNQARAQLSWPRKVIRAVGRLDYLNSRSDHEAKCRNESQPFKKDQEDNDGENSWTSHILQMGIFLEDRRLEEVFRLLDSSSPLSVEVEQRAEMSDHEYVEEQEKALLQQVQVSFSASVGRAAFLLQTEEKNFANLTSNIFVPKLCFSGKCAIKGTNIELNESDLPASSTAWPHFHNSTAAALSVRFLDSPADAWFAYNKSKTSEGPEQAGMILGFGLNGILASMPPTLRHEYLAKENSFITMAILLGLAANQMGSGDIATWKLISLHISAMLPACTTELEIPRFATLVAPLCLGLLFMNTHTSHIAKVLLGEISKRYSPLSSFGAVNASSTNVNFQDMSVLTPDREAHTLCAGFGLGFVNLGKGKLNDGGIDDGIDGVLRRFVVGGPKPAHPQIADEDDLFNQYEHNMPSLWEEYRCCHIQEGDNVNVDVTTPSAIVAVALIYLRSGNEAVLNWLSPPATLHLLDGVRPDLLMLRALASILVYETVDRPEIAWLEAVLMPEALAKNALKQPEENCRMDHESINQAWASIVCGYCLGLGIRFAGTSDEQVIETLWHYANLFLNMASTGSKLAEFFPKNFLESSTCTILLALSLVNAGTGNVKVLRLCRYLQSKIATGGVVTSSSNAYGFEMCVSMATGILFLGGGRYSLSNDDRSIAVLLASVFPKWPVNSSDNRYHLQALRHLYVLAAQPRLILPKVISQTSKPVVFKIEFRNGKVVELKPPVLLPPFYMIKKIQMVSKTHLPVEFRLPEDENYLKEIVENGGEFSVVEKPLAQQDLGLMEQMGWRQKHSFHPSFRLTDEIPSEERIFIEKFSLISRLAKWNGIPSAVPAFLNLLGGDVSDPDWIWQLRALYWWKLKCEKKKMNSAISNDLLAILLAKGEGKVKLFVTESGQDIMPAFTTPRKGVGETLPPLHESPIDRESNSTFYSTRSGHRPNSDN